MTPEKEKEYRAHSELWGHEIEEVFQEIDCLRAENSRLREAAGRVMEDSYSFHDRQDDGSWVGRPAIDALRDALKEKA